MIPTEFIYLSVLISLVGIFRYWKSILKGDTKPNLVSQFMWMLSPFIGVFFQIKADSGLATLALFMSGFASLSFIVTALVVKNGYWEIKKFDLICGLLSLSALVCYVITHNLGISILFAIAADTLAYFPTIKKSYSNPETEDNSIYVAGILNHIIALLVLQNRIFTNYAFSFSIIFWNSVLLLVIYRKQITSIFLRKSDII